MNLKRNLVIGLLIIVAFSSCDNKENYSMQYVGNYKFTTTEYSQYGNYCADTIRFDGTIYSIGNTKLKIVYKLPATTCNTPYNTGSIDVDVDQEGLLWNPTNPYELRQNFSGAIFPGGQFMLTIHRY